MALVKCSQCEHEVAESAATCPSCGHDLMLDSTSGSIVSLLVFVFGIGAIAYGLYSVFFI